MKPKRIENKELLKKYHKKPCVVCGSIPSDPHHLKSRGAGGDDVETNLIALCRKCHSLIHSIGLTQFVELYETMTEILYSKGWVYDNNFRRWKRDLG